ncbi:hypothetical protein L682_30085 [Aquipseudomonas alcaligenes OT 69]|nr:hypothetical protein L682_30085 [Pseudomonas alcaligenes OT 69]
MTAKSFKQMIRDGELKRADAMKARLEDLHEEPGFNLRAEGEDLEQSIAVLAEYLHQGGVVPPLEVRPRAEGGMWVVDGHRRRRAYLKLDAEGRLPRDDSGQAWIAITAFTGNDAERVLRVITSQEGRKLTQLELAEGYKRLAAFGWSNEQIAQKMGRTRQHVDQVLTVGNANTDVQQLVKDGAVSATVAASVVRKHGDKAGKVLQSTLEKVKAMKEPEIPRPLLESLYASCKSIADSLPEQVRTAIGEGAEIITVTLKANQLERFTDLVRQSTEALEG